MDCGIVERQLKLQSRYYIHFRKNTLEKDMNARILQAIGEIEPLLFYYNDFGIR